MTDVTIIDQGRGNPRAGRPRVAIATRRRPDPLAVTGWRSWCSGAVRPAVGHRPGSVLLLVPAAARSVHPLRLDRPDRVRLFAGVPADPAADPGAAWQAFMAVWTGLLLAAVYVLTGRWFVVGVALSRWSWPAATSSCSWRRRSCWASAGRRPGRSSCSRRSRPGSGCCGSSSGASGGSSPSRWGRPP